MSRIEAEYVLRAATLPLYAGIMLSSPSFPSEFAVQRDHLPDCVDVMFDLYRLIMRL